MNAERSVIEFAFLSSILTGLSSSYGSISVGNLSSEIDDDSLALSKIDDESESSESSESLLSFDVLEPLELGSPRSSFDLLIDWLVSLALLALLSESLPSSISPKENPIGCGMLALIVTAFGVGSNPIPCAGPSGPSSEMVIAIEEGPPRARDILS